MNTSNTTTAICLAAVDADRHDRMHPPLRPTAVLSWPSDQTATLRINPPMANIGVELVAVNDFPFLAEEDASLKAGRNTLHLNVWADNPVGHADDRPGVRNDVFERRHRIHSQGFDHL